MELKQIIRYSDVFVGVMIIFKAIIVIANEFLMLINGKYPTIVYKKYTNLLEDIINVVNKPVRAILIVWFIVKMGMAFILYSI